MNISQVAVAIGDSALSTKSVDNTVHVSGAGRPGGLNQHISYELAKKVPSPVFLSESGIYV
ncbi:hypothetical protein J5837_04330 [Pseudoxanthomonas helianthi]|uniref:Uncharacterized protein n=1 Tax=Pseudoxanthomonas helianthi TaxID=1453541 RepID=A0A940X1P4_9GAMM|nr:hypothetical protein [Pseudoxanthomonas helianthi]MBP3983646.1 hypothetical protein [Pseudoxanthomonas helianthi]